VSEAVNRYHIAKGYFQSVFMILRSPDRNSEKREMLTLLSMSLLAGFALELYFKAWLLASGRPSRQVRAYGHKIRELYAEAKAEGLPATTGLSELVDALATGHQDFTFRYLNDGDVVQNIRWSVAVQVLDKLDNVVDAKVGASASYGLDPGH